MTFKSNSLTTDLYIYIICDIYSHKFIQLVADGLAERIPHKGVRVSPIDENEIAEIYYLRLLLEPIVVRLAVIRISSHILEEKQQLRGL